MGQLTPLDYKQILPIFESVSVDTVVKERDLEEMVGAPEGGNMRFEDAVRAAAKDTDPAWYGSVATPLHLVAIAAGVVSGKPLTQVPLNLATAVLATVTAANEKERGDSPVPALAVAVMNAVLSVGARRSSSRIVRAGYAATVAELVRRFLR